MPELRQAIDQLNDRICAACAIGEALDAAAGPDGGPPWVYVYRDQLEAIRDAAEAVELAFHRGVGVVDPDGQPAPFPPAPLSTRAPLDPITHGTAPRPVGGLSSASE